MSLAVCTNRNSGAFVGVLSCAVALNGGGAHKNAAEKKTSASLLVAGRGRRAIALPPLLSSRRSRRERLPWEVFTSAADGTAPFACCKRCVVHMGGKLDDPGHARTHPSMGNQAKPAHWPRETRGEG